MEEEHLESGTWGIGSTSWHHFIFLGRLSGLIWDLSLSFPVQDPCSGRGLEVLNCGRSSMFLLAWISLLTAGGNSTSHGDLSGLFKMAFRFFCTVHLPQITADTPDFDLMRQLLLQWAIQQRAWGSCLSPVHRQSSWFLSSSSFSICSPCP